MQTPFEGSVFVVEGDQTIEVKLPRDHPSITPPEVIDSVLFPYALTAPEVVRVGKLYGQGMALAEAKRLIDAGRSADTLAG